MDPTALKCGCPGCDGRACAVAAPVAWKTRESREHAWLDRLFLHPRWGLVGSMLVFGGVLFVVFQGSAWRDAMTTARLADALS
ncbi:MAG TPA: hypothetical protein VF309_01930, partial [Usitatibacter sp.]